MNAAAALKLSLDAEVVRRTMAQEERSRVQRLMIAEQRAQAAAAERSLAGATTTTTAALNDGYVYVVPSSPGAYSNAGYGLTK